MTERAATVVGAGVASPAGSDLDELWRAVVEARGTRAEVIPYEGFPDGGVLGCRAAGFEPAERLERHELRRLDRVHQLAFWAADDALAAAGPGPEPERCAVVVGTGFGAATFHEQQLRALHDRGFRAVSPLAIPVVMPNSVAGHLSLRHGFRGPSLSVATACASGTDAIGEALWLLRSGRADRVLAGGVDSLHTIGVTASFARLEAMSRRLDDPAASSRPFDADRDGFVLGEGAAFVVLERAADATGGLGRVLGHAATCDAHHLVAPPDDGGGAIACVRAALADAGLEPDQVGHVNAHGTSTERNDLAEATALAAVFGERAVPVTATKGVTGHLIAAAGALEAIVALRSIAESTVPPIANLTCPDPALDHLVRTDERAPRSPTAVSTSFGFGGHDAALVLA